MAHLGGAERSVGVAVGGLLLVASVEGGPCTGQTLGIGRLETGDLRVQIGQAFQSLLGCPDLLDWRLVDGSLVLLLGLVNLQLSYVGIPELFRGILVQRLADLELSCLRIPAFLCGLFVQRLVFRLASLGLKCLGTPKLLCSTFFF